MEEVPGALGPFEITDADVTASKPRVRALLVARYEAMYKVVQARISMDAAGEMPMDPRMLEIGLRVSKELSTLYQMGARIPPPADEEEEDPGAGVDRAGLIEARLAELEAAREKQQQREQES